MPLGAETGVEGTRGEAQEVLLSGFDTILAGP